MVERRGEAGFPFQWLLQHFIQQGHPTGSPHNPSWAAWGKPRPNSSAQLLFPPPPSVQLQLQLKTTGSPTLFHQLLLAALPKNGAVQCYAGNRMWGRDHRHTGYLQTFGKKKNKTLKGALFKLSVFQCQAPCTPGRGIALAGPGLPNICIDQAI